MPSYSQASSITDEANTLTNFSYYNKIDLTPSKSLKDITTLPPSIIEEYLSKESFPNEDDLNEISRRYDIPDGLLFAMFWKESQFTCNSSSEKGASGCFQFRPLTAKKMGILSDHHDYRTHPWISADAAARYLTWNFKFLGLKNTRNTEEWKFAVAAYNAGPNRIKTSSGLRIPLFTETQYYVEDIIGYIEGDKHIVKPGDLIESIAKNNQLHLATFRLLNGKISNKTIQKGSFVTIKEPIKFYRYTVQPGDNLVKIAALTGVSIQIIGQTNNIKLLTSIESGQTLYLPLF
jgi:LysM repeat protein